MKKVGIITFHDGFNHGAFMQVFSLKKAVEELGYQCEIINYKPFYFFVKEYLHFAKKDGEFLKNFKKMAKFKSLHKSKLKLGKAFFSDKNIGSDYDTVVFGSDEIWNINNPALNLNLTYFGKGIEVKKISYAPSFGSTLPNDPSLEKVKGHLAQFDGISVRDYNSKAIVKSLLDRDVQVVPDPTFLIDHEDSCVTPLQKNYILVYIPFPLNSNQEEKLKKQAVQQDKKIISIGFKQNIADVNVIDIDPFQWMGYIKHADIVVTSMFHGTVFSIIFEKPLVLLMTNYRFNKFSHLVEVFGLEKNIEKGEKMCLEKNAIIPEFSNKKILKEKGLDFLRGNLI